MKLRRELTQHCSVRKVVFPTIHEEVRSQTQSTENTEGREHGSPDSPRTITSPLRIVINCFVEFQRNVETSTNTDKLSAVVQLCNRRGGENLHTNSHKTRVPCICRLT